jgi:hypothetical protein
MEGDTRYKTAREFAEDAAQEVSHVAHLCKSCQQWDFQRYSDLLVATLEKMLIRYGESEAQRLRANNPANEERL